MTIYPTNFYEAHNIPTCPNGDKVRSDDQGLFCLVDGVRVPYPVVALTEPSPAAIEAATIPTTPAPVAQPKDAPTPAPMVPSPVLPTAPEAVPAVDEESGVRSQESGVSREATG